MKSYYPLLFLILLVATTGVHAQIIDDAFIKRNLSEKVYSIDSDAEAVVLFEKTTIHMEGTLRTGYTQTQTIRKLIKILKPAAIKEADVSTPIVNKQGINDVTGTTYTLSNGEMKKIDLASGSLYRKEVAGGFYNIVFSLPEVKEGDIIEYKYSIKTQPQQILPPWKIQGEYPKLQTVYELEVPKTFDYAVVAQGNLSFKEIGNIRDAIETAGGYHVARAEMYNSNLYSVVWGEKNVPAIVDEPFVNYVGNHASRMDFQLSDFETGNVLYNQHMFKTWDKVDAYLWAEENFGKKILRSSTLLEKKVDSLIQGATTQLQKAKSIFNYVRSNIECSSTTGIYLNNSFNKILESKRGDVGDINLTLTTMLRYAGITASPVILSKLGGLRSYEAYPLINRLNYVVCRIVIDSTPYYLDATDKNNPFGILPHYCYNGYARVIDKHGQGVYLIPDDLKNKNIYTVNISGIDDSFVVARVFEKLGLINSAGIRKRWIKDSTTIKDYGNKETRLFSDEASLSDMAFVNLDNPDTDLIIKYTIKIKNETKARIHYFNTDYIKFFNENPFKAAHRYFPIEFQNRMENVYSMNIQVPEKYKIEEIPKPTVLSFEDDQMSFGHYVSYDSTLRLLSVNVKFVTGKASFNTSAYDVMRQFFEKMVTEENAVITIKKQD